MNVSRRRLGIASLVAGFFALALAGSALAWTAPGITPLCSTTAGEVRWTVTLSGTESSYDFQTSSDGTNWSADIAGVQGDNLVVTASATLYARWSADHSSMTGPVTNTVGPCEESSPSPSPSEITTGGGESPSPSPSMSPEESASPSMSPEESASPSMSPEESESPSPSEITTGGGPTPTPSESETTTGGGVQASATPTGEVLGITTTPPPTDSTGSGHGSSPLQPVALLLLSICAFAGGISLLAPVRVKRH